MGSVWDSGRENFQMSAVTIHLHYVIGGLGAFTNPVTCLNERVTCRAAWSGHVTLPLTLTLLPPMAQTIAVTVDEARHVYAVHSLDTKPQRPERPVVDIHNVQEERAIIFYCS